MAAINITEQAVAAAAAAGFEVLGGFASFVPANCPNVPWINHSTFGKILNRRKYVILISSTKYTVTMFEKKTIRNVDLGV